MKNKTICPDCGSAPVNHFLERLQARVDHYFLPLLAPLAKLANWLEPKFAPVTIKIWLAIIKMLVFLHLAEVKSAPDEKNNGRSKVLWEEAKRRGIEMREFRPLGRYVDSYLASFKGRTIFFDGLPRPAGKKSDALNWMDDKAEMARRFAEKNIPTARGGKVKTWLAALALFSSLKKPIIVKPVSGSRGRHTTLHINKEEELRRGLDIARQLSPWVVVQEELTGPVYRVTVIGGKLQAVLRRDPAGVIGDGIHSIRALAETENKNPLRQGPLFHHLPLDLGAEEELSRQNFTWESIPAMGLFVALGTKTSRGMGGALVDVTDVVHPDNNALFEKIGSVLVDPLVGIDFIIMDIKKSWKVQDQCGVIECNSLPFIDLHHFPLQGQPRNVAGAVWELVFCDF